MKFEKRFLGKPCMRILRNMRFDLLIAFNIVGFLIGPIGDLSRPLLANQVSDKLQDD